MILSGALDSVPVTRDAIAEILDSLRVRPEATIVQRNASDQIVHVWIACEMALASFRIDPETKVVTGSLLPWLGVSPPVLDLGRSGLTFTLTRPTLDLASARSDALLVAFWSACLERARGRP
jgi:hypothetical protein